jgi:fructuronate reductase
MAPKILCQDVLDDAGFWSGKGVSLPGYRRLDVPVKSLCFSAGRMAYGHTGDILQDLLDNDPAAGAMIGVETYALRYVADLAACDYLMTQLIYENEKDRVVPKIQGAIQSVLFVDDNRASMSWGRLMELARDPRLQYATINAPEGVYGVSYTGGAFAEPVSEILKTDMVEGTVVSDPAKWTAFALERFKAGRKFALVSCTNFSGNGHYTGATVRAVARAWEERGHAPAGFVDYLRDPGRFSFPNCMIDRIAVPPDDKTQQAMERLELISNVVVTERTRYWAVEDVFPAGRPPLEEADGVFMAKGYDDVKKYEDMKLRILNMSHSVMAHLGVLLGYRGRYGIYRAMQDEDIRKIITGIIDLVLETVDRPERMDPRDFAADAIERLNNPNIPDDPMRIALNGSTKMLPRFMDTFYAACEKGGIDRRRLEVVLLPVAGFLRYTLGIDDRGERFELESDPIKDTLEACGKGASLGEPASARAFHTLIADATVMGRDLYQLDDTGAVVQEMAAAMLEGDGAVRKAVRRYLTSS